MSSRVALIIVTHNGEQYVGDLFASLAADTIPKDRLGIFVVDNASTDGTAPLVIARSRATKQSPSNSGLPRPASSGARNDGQLSVTFIQNATNAGFAAGNNIAIRHALEQGYEWITLLNQDTVVKSGYLEECLRVAETDDRIGAVQPLLALWPPERSEINSLGNEIHFLGFGFSRGYKSKFPPVIASPDATVGAKQSPGTGLRRPRGGLVMTNEEITYASGAAVLYRAAALRDIGLFHDDFFMYHEDLDLGWRLWLRGWKSVLAPQATVYHKYDFRAAAYKYYFMERNRLVVLLQNYKWQTLLLISPAFLLMEFGVLGFSILKGWWRQKLRGYWWVLTHLSAIVKNRAAIQKVRVASDRVITGRLVGAILYQEIDNLILRRFANPFFTLYWSLLRNFIFW